ncbi:TRAP-type C4-dicarboxylate transport system periplasmic component-like protein [Candidatus Vecturithrix granuli]|uniref:TRAP-type C4-dicarboxylate transport system periplasmic component-like protein n=1 Tax=Vecturithrix granuli TaxID=1499967 RepID=A0A0S6WA82_VECG1|nr:TRAP-type C4-dicarboxylate transport system periplasmic component-like protein [Candidatus Vecturithrix granuli]
MKTFMAFILLTMIAVTQVGAQMLPKMRISVENAPSHVQTKAVQGFAEELQQQLAGRIAVEFYSNAQLFRDNDVIQALMHGKVEMAVPGTWQFDRFDPNVGIFLLPIFYGRSAQTYYAILAGKIGDAINGKIEERLHLKVVGRWLDLGHAHLFSIGKPIVRYEDIRDMRIRVAGGIANELRIQALGGIPTSIAWPDLPAYLQQGTVDGILTSYETIRSAKLWEYGVNYGFEDREYFPQYIPLIRLSFWNKLPGDIQEIVLTTWDKHVDPAREKAAAMQTQAKAILLEQGVKIIVPDEDAIEQQRYALLSRQDEFVARMNIDPELVKQLLEAFREEGL